MPVGDVGFLDPPAEEHQTILPQGVEVDQPGIEALEQTADRLDLFEVFGDPIG
jgi:hypothetical protein